MTRLKPKLVEKRVDIYGDILDEQDASSIVLTLNMGTQTAGASKQFTTQQSDPPLETSREPGALKVMNSTGDICSKKAMNQAKLVQVDDNGTVMRKT